MYTLAGKREVGECHGALVKAMRQWQTGSAPEDERVGFDKFQAAILLTVAAMECLGFESVHTAEETIAQVGRHLGFTVKSSCEIDPDDSDWLGSHGLRIDD